VSGAWRYRTCPRCGTESPASEFGYVGTYAAAWSQDEWSHAKRRCPGCRYEATTGEFPVTRDTRTGFVAETAEWRAEYARVLGSARWRKLRLETVGRQRFRCAHCGAFGGVSRSTLELHHLHYRTLGEETAVDVVALCKVCHSNADLERAKAGRASASSAHWSARLRGWAETVGMDPDYPGTEDAFESWLERQGDG
jgi:5-methylcytosine-specific restriction endonuclease McrA